MTKETQAVSLLPFLSPTESRIFLKIPRKTPELARTCPYPFPVLNESDIFSRLLPASLVSQSGEKIKNIYLLLQKDEQFSLQIDSLLDNGRINELWREISGTYSREEELLHLFAGGGPDSSEPPLYAPLLFCSRKNVYFHPPCPECGGRLSQCLDDDVLSAAGLKPFSTSLKRYLYCPSCFTPSEKNVFYGRDNDQADPDFVLDFSGLCKLFGPLSAENHAPAALPCAGCAEREECFGPADLALERISPLSFYSFHMLASGELPLQALDFLAMTVGELLSAAMPQGTTESPKTAAVEVRPAPPVGKYSEDDRIVHAILTRLRTKWLDETAGLAFQETGPGIPLTPPPSEAGAGEGDMEKTVILNTAELFPERVTPPAADDRQPPPVSPAGPEEEDMEKTVILNTAELFPERVTPPAADDRQPPPVRPAGSEEEDMEKTVILNTAELFPERVTPPAADDRQPPPVSPAEFEEEDMEKTVIIDTAAPSAAPGPKNTEQPEVDEDEDDIEETQILSAEKIAQLMKKRQDG